MKVIAKARVLVGPVFLMLVAQTTAQSVTWFSTTPGNLWRQQTLEMRPLSAEQSPAIRVLANNEEQTIDGFGGCFNEKGWEALKILPATASAKLFQELFSPEGSHFTICRTPIGASDYALSYYSLNDTPNDYEMKNFNIDRDRNCLIPYIKSALAVNPHLKIWASPWCPPFWMKSNNHYACKPEHKGVRNDLRDEDVIIPGTTAFKMQEGTLSAYALYFSKFLDAYKAEGIQIYAIHVQNEPLAYQSFPSCTWRAEDLAIFIGGYLGPRFEREHRKTEIWFGTINNDDVKYFRAALTESNASPYIRGVGFQWAGKRAIAEVHQEFPSLKLMQTESECGDGSNDWKASDYTWTLIKHYLENGATAYMYWNMILDETGRSTWGWVQNSLVRINQKTAEVTYTPEFYLMRHLAHNLQPGAKRLATSGSDDLLAFRNPNGDIVLTTANTTINKQSFNVNVGGKVLAVELPGKSYDSFVIPAGREIKAQSEGKL